LTMNNSCTEQFKVTVCLFMYVCMHECVYMHTYTCGLVCLYAVHGLICIYALVSHDVFCVFVYACVCVCVVCACVCALYACICACALCVWVRVCVCLCCGCQLCYVRVFTLECLHS